eukprot:XP_001691952.1 SNF2 superfamily protein [Chlamydomonas reinhardtii]
MAPSSALPAEPPGLPAAPAMAMAMPLLPGPLPYPPPPAASGDRATASDSAVSLVESPAPIALEILPNPTPPPPDTSLVAGHDLWDVGRRWGKAVQGVSKPIESWVGLRPRPLAQQVRRERQRQRCRLRPVFARNANHRAALRVRAAKDDKDDMVSGVFKTASGLVDKAADLVPDSVPRSTAKAGVTVAGVMFTFWVLNKVISGVVTLAVLAGIGYYFLTQQGKDDDDAIDVTPKAGGGKAGGGKAGGGKGSDLDDPLAEARKIMDKYKCSAGTSDATRKAAAKQLSEIARSHPDQLLSTVQKVHAYLYHKSWETRVAAGEALGYLADIFVQQTPDELRQQALACGVDEASLPPCEGPLTFSGFSLQQVLEKGTPLGASGGQEFDLVLDPGMTPKARLAAQRDVLKRRLGLDRDMGLDADAFAAAAAAAAAEIGEDEHAWMWHMRVRAQTGWPVKAPIPTSIRTTAVLLLRAVQAVADGGWPFQRLGDQLVVDSLDPVWEVRHGAALALRELLRSHAWCAAVEVPLDEASAAWARFGDYGSDQVTAPVRETAAQALGMALQALDGDSVAGVACMLRELQAHGDWRVRYGGFCGLKYLLAARLDLAPALLPAALPLLRAGLADPDDDVRAACADALVPVAGSLGVAGPQAVSELRRQLWDLLPQLSDLSAATNSVMSLLAHLTVRGSVMQCLERMLAAAEQLRALIQLATTQVSRPLDPQIYLVPSPEEPARLALEQYLHVCVLAALAAASAASGRLPDKFNSAIQPLMNSLRREPQLRLQEVCAGGLAELLGLCAGRTPSPNDKLVRNIVAMATAELLPPPGLLQPGLLQPGLQGQGSGVLLPSGGSLSLLGQQQGESGWQWYRGRGARPRQGRAFTIELVVVPLLNSSDDTCRLGGVEAVAALCGELGSGLVPYAVLLLVPLLRRMSDPAADVRAAAAGCFGSLMTLLPLAQGVPPPPGLDGEQLACVSQDSAFLLQLLDNRRVDAYALPFPLPPRLPYNLLVMSYEALRADVELLLSGTPIQNDEARGSKRGSREAEAGLLALEGLHRSLLPFVLRRTKGQASAEAVESLRSGMVLDLQLPAHRTAANAVLRTTEPTAVEAALRRGGLRHAPKLAALRDILATCGHKALLDLVERDLLAPYGVSYLRLDGGVEAGARFAVVQRFNADPTIDVLLLTTGVGGVGLNLTAADTVVFLEHDWNPMKDMQAMDRAHRLGQRRTVNVYRILTRGTLEERVLGLQQFKKDVAEAGARQR